MRQEDIIKSEALEFYEYGDWKGKQIIPTVQDFSSGLKLELSNHQIDGQIIYLEKIIRLINNDAQEHLKTCKNKDKPNECPTHQFYAKIKYYAEQILDSIAGKTESVVPNYELNNNLSKETISVIEDLLDGKRYSLTKDSPNEVSTIIARLNNLGFLNKFNNHSYAMHHANRKSLAKLLELKSWSKFKEWLNKEENSKETTLVNNFYKSSVGKINQAIGESKIKNSESKTQESPKTSWLNKLYWVIGIIVSLIVVYEFVIKNFIK